MYSKKYLKYKQKYVNLKNKFINQVGGNGRIILFTLNNDYKTVHQFVIHNPSDSFDRFKSIVLADPNQCRILNNNILIEDNAQFSELPPFSIINICNHKVCYLNYQKLIYLVRKLHYVEHYLTNLHELFFNIHNKNH